MYKESIQIPVILKSLKEASAQNWGVIFPTCWEPRVCTSSSGCEGPLAQIQSTVLCSVAKRQQDRSYRGLVMDFSIFNFLKGVGKKCSKRDTGLNKFNLGFIPGITRIFKNFWKSCLSATVLLNKMSYLPNSFQALEFTVKREMKKPFICS